MANTLQVHPDCVYDEGAVSLALDLPLATLERARREGRLQFTRKDRRIFFLGRWLLDWFADHKASEEVQK